MMGYLSRSYVGDVSNATMAAMTALGRLRASRNAETVDVAIGMDGDVYATTFGVTMEKAVTKGRLLAVGTYTGTASVGDVAEDIEFAWQGLTRSNRRL